MAMTLFLHDRIEPTDASYYAETGGYAPPATPRTDGDEFHILRHKLSIPDTHGTIVRPRINQVLDRSFEQFPATLISGRSGTGKTAAAAMATEGRERVSWYSVGSADIDWMVFTRYFAECVSGKSGRRMANAFFAASGPDPDETDIARFLIALFSGSYAEGPPCPSLMVLDDIHHIFDAGWFEVFFNLMLHALPSDNRLLLLCRSKPPGPLWRLRSKQVLNVIDERLIAFTPAETETLFDHLGIERTRAGDAHRKTFGRISKLLKLCEDARAVC